MISDRMLARALPGPTVALLGDLIRVTVGIAVLLALAFVAVYYRFQGDHLNDFKVFYYSTQAWFSGLDMYGPTPATSVPVGGGRFHDLWNMNPPHFHVLLLPFAGLPLIPAMAAWVALNVGLVICCLVAITRALDVRWTATGAVWCALAVMASSATGGLVATGQVAWIVMVPVTYAWIAARHGRWSRSALLLGIAASIKPFLGVFLIYFALKRSWREAGLMLAAGGACGLAGVAVFGWQPYLNWLAALRAVDWAWAPMNCSIVGFLTRVFSQNPFVPALADAPVVIRPMALTIGGILGVITFRTIVRGDSTTAVDRSFAALLILALLLAPLGWVYYLWLAAGPLLALFWFRPNDFPRPVKVALLFAAPGLLWPLYFFVWTRLLPGSALTFTAIYFWTALFLWTALMFLPRQAAER